MIQRVGRGEEIMAPDLSTADGTWRRPFIMRVGDTWWDRELKANVTITSYTEGTVAFRYEGEDSTHWAQIDRFLDHFARVKA